MKSFIPSFMIAAVAVFFSVTAVSAATLTIDECSDFATTTSPGDILSIANDFSCVGRGSSEDISGVTVEGNGYTITIEDDLGLFGDTEDVMIQNLTIAGTIAVTSGIGGLGETASSTIVTNVTNTLQFTAGPSDFVLGTAAFFADVDTGGLTLTSSTFNGSFTFSNLGGLNAVVAADIEGDLVLENNTFLGSMTFTGNGSGMSRIAIAGASVGIDANTLLTVTSTNNVYNTTITITHSTTTPSQMSSIGQVFADLGGQSGQNHDIAFVSTNDTIGGALSVSTTHAIIDIGSLAGKISSRASTTISGLEVTGTLTAISSWFIDGVGVAGIGSTGGDIIWSNSTSTRSATLTLTHVSSSDVGEIGTWVGDFGGSTGNFSSLNSTGDIIVNAEGLGNFGVFVDEIGGAIGNTDSENLYATNMSHSGDITISTYGEIERIGGLFGLVDGSDATTTLSRYSGTITASSTDETEFIGGIVGESNGSDMWYVAVTSTGELIISGDFVDDIGGFAGKAGGDTMVDGIYVVGDIIIDNVSITAEAIGGVFGSVGDDIWATSTYMTGDITVTTGQSAEKIGGIFGYIEDDDATIDTTAYTGTITITSDSAEYVGGIIGDFAYDYELELSNAVTNGSVTTTARDVLAYGGIIGGFNDYPEDVTMTNLTNNLDITIRSASSSPEVEGVAGIIGYHDDDDDYVYVMTNVTNNGDITVYSAIENAEVFDIGGIVGHYDAEDDNEDLSTQIINTGDITIYAAASSTEVYNIGGIVGYIYDWFGMSGVTSTGDITIYAAASGTNIDDIGGMFGYSDDDTYIYNTRILSDITIYANGPNSDVSGVGGIAGTFDGYDWDVTSTYYMGDITIEGGYEIDSVGGVLGRLDGGDVLTVSTTYAVADIMLSLGQSSHNMVYRVGGFVGYKYDNVEVTNSFAAGSINITASTGSSASSTVVYDVGGFAGVVEDTVAVNTYADVDIDITTANDDVKYVGGYAGRVSTNKNSDTEISYSFAAGDIDITAGGSSSGVGGFIGDHVSSTLISNNYYDIYRTGQASCEGSGALDGCTGYNENNYAATTGYLVNTMSSAPVDTWDFDDVWQLDADYYPVLAFVPYDGSITLGTGSESSGGGGTYVPPTPPRTSRGSLESLDMDEDGARVSGAFSINSGAAETNNRTVSLTFTDIENTSQVAVSESPTFAGASYQPFADTLSYTLSTGNGTKTVYAKLRSSEGATLVLKDTIVLTGTTEQPTPGTTATPINPNQALQCTSNVYLTTAVGPGRVNNPADVRLLEEFLNTYENTNLPVNGIYEPADIAAVIAWQEKYAADILTPWGITNGTGYVFTTSLAKIKEIHEANCATATPTPTTPVVPPTTTGCLNTTDTLRLGMNNAFVVTAQRLLKNLSYFPADIDTTGYFGPVTETATRAFQGANGIDQVGFIGPQTRARLNKLGCN